MSAFRASRPAAWLECCDDHRVSSLVVSGSGAMAPIAVALPLLKRRVGFEDRIEMADQKQAASRVRSPYGGNEMARPMRATSCRSSDRETQRLQLGPDHLPAEATPGRFSAPLFWFTHLEHRHSPTLSASTVRTMAPESLAGP